MSAWHEPSQKSYERDLFWVIVLVLEITAFAVIMYAQAH